MQVFITSLCFSSMAVYHMSITNIAVHDWSLSAKPVSISHMECNTSLTSFSLIIQIYIYHHSLLAILLFVTTFYQKY